MHPLLLNLGPIPIHTYGVAIASGFLLGVSVIKRLSIRAKLDPGLMIDLAFWVLLTGFLGARVLFVLTQWELFRADPLSIFKVWEGGLVFLGGPIAAMPFAIWFVRKYGASPWKTLDVQMPGLVLGHAFGRLGCFASGCCYGTPTESWTGVVFNSELIPRELRSLPLHPTQLYESLSLFVLFAGLLWVFRRRVFDGQVALTYFMAYPLIRSVVEMFRGDSERGFVIPGVLSTSQFLSILIFMMASAALAFRLRQLQRAKEATA